MKIEFLKSGKIYADCRTWYDQQEGDIMGDIPAEHCKTLMDYGWVKEYVETIEESAEVPEDTDPVEPTREQLEDIYKDLGGRARDSWSDDKLKLKISEKQA